MISNLLRLGAILLIFIVYPGSLKASHIQGAYISYQYIDTNTYLVTVLLHRDCWGIPAPATVTVCYTSVGEGISGTIDLLPLPGTGDTIPLSSCYPAPSICLGGIGRQEWIYADTLILPQPASDWVLSYIIPGFFGVSGFPSTPVNGYVRATLNSINYPVNSTPLFNDTAYYLYCINSYSTINYNCSDPDGDSLVYTLTGGLIGTDTCPPVFTPYVYMLPYSPTNPFSSSTPITLNASTGLFEFTPNIIQVAWICIKISEYRNGILISSFTRDDQIIVTNSTGMDEMDGMYAAIAPNPFTSLLNVTVEKNDQVRFQLADITGRTLMMKDFVHSATINTQDLAPGIYIYHIFDNKNNSMSGKLVKQ